MLLDAEQTSKQTNEPKSCLGITDSSNDDDYDVNDGDNN